MIKALIIYVISFAVLFLALQYSHEFILNHLDSSVRFELFNTNLFFAVASLLICVHLQIFSSLKTLERHLGFIYLPTLFVKGILFFIAFKESVFGIEVLTITERVSLLIPFLLFLGLEVLFVVKILMKNEA